jgi:RimJ/RimL family protein N-acetyltransferase
MAESLPQQIVTASLRETEDFIASCMAAWADGARQAYAIERTEGDAAIGMIEARPQGHKIDIGYVLARAHRGQGLMPEAIAAVAAAALSAPAIFRECR